MDQRLISDVNELISYDNRQGLLDFFKESAKTMLLETTTIVPWYWYTEVDRVRTLALHTNEELLNLCEEILLFHAEQNEAVKLPVYYVKSVVLGQSGRYLEALELINNIIPLCQQITSITKKPLMYMYKFKLHIQQYEIPTPINEIEETLSLLEGSML